MNDLSNGNERANIERAIEQAIKDGLVVEREGMLILTEKGMLLGDALEESRKATKQ